MTPAVAARRPKSEEQRAAMSAAAAKAFEEARVLLVMTHPFLASASMDRPVVEDWTCRTAWTDGRRFGYNPAFICGVLEEEQGEDKMIGLCGHEAWHNVLEHHLRREWRKPKPWNIACDKVVNALCEADQMALPNGGIPAGPADKYAEELYEEGQDGEDGDEGDEGDDGDGDGGVEVRDMMNEDGSPLSEAERELEERKCKETVQQAINMARAIGTLPAGLDRAIDAATPRVPWKRVLADVLSVAARDDYDFRVPNKRHIGRGVMLPSLRSETFGRVVTCGDVSWSVPQEAVSQIAAEVLSLLEQMAPDGEAELTMAWFDTEVYTQVVTRAEDIQPRGGGGTSYVQVFDWVAGRHPGEHPAGDCLAVIVTTDGDCNDFGTDPGVAVLWILTRPNRNFAPPFGRVAWTFDK